MIKRKKKNRIYESKGEPVFQFLLVVFFVFISFLFIYPYWQVLVDSFNTPGAAQMTGLKLWPGNFTLDAYSQMLQTNALWSGYWNTIKVCVVGWLFSIVLTVLGAYPLSKKDLPLRNMFTVVIVLTMFVSGGLIPTYLLINNTLEMRNTLLSITLPSAISTYNLIIMRNYFMSLPIELEEAAIIDGANSLQILVRVIIPLSMPMLATISLWVIVSNWNAYFNCLLYITDSSKFVLQVILRRIIQSDSKEMTDIGTAGELLNTDVFTLRFAAIILSTLPIICVYPFIQKYFVKGVMLGSVKG